MDIVKELAKNLKQKRTEKGYTREKLGALADVSAGAIALYENGTSKSPSLTVVAKLAQALEVSIDELCGLSKDLLDISKQSEGKRYPLSEILMMITLLTESNILQPLRRIALEEKHDSDDESLLELSKEISKYGKCFIIDNFSIEGFLDAAEQINELSSTGVLENSIYDMATAGLYNKYKGYSIKLFSGGFVITDPNGKEL